MNQPLMLTVLGRCFVLFACIEKVQPYWSFTMWCWQSMQGGDAVHCLVSFQICPHFAFFYKLKKYPFFMAKDIDNYI